MSQRLDRTRLFAAILSLIGVILTPGGGAVSAQGLTDNYYYLPLVSGQAWTLSYVDSPRYFSDMGAWAVGFQSVGNPCLVYGNDHLYYACRVSGRWTIQVVDANYGVGRYATLAFTPDGFPGIAYYDEGNGALKYAEFRGGSWSIEIVDDRPPADEGVLREAPALGEGDESGPLYGLVSKKQGVGGFPSLAFDAGGNPRISYFDFDQMDLKYAWKDGGPWNTETVDSAGVVGLYTSLDLDSSGSPYVAYYDVTNGDLKLASRAVSGAWSLSTPDSTGNVGLYASLALDHLNRPRIAYYDATNRRLRYWSDGAIATFSQYNDIGQFASLRLDSSERPWISFYNNASTSLGLLHQTAQGTWVYQTVDSGDMVGRSGSLALDSDGNVGIVYYHSSNCQLRYAQGKSSFAVQALDTNTITGVYVTMGVYGTQPRIVYLNDSQSRLKYAPLVGDAWQFETISALNDTGVHPSIAVSPGGTTHVSFWQYYGGTPEGIMSSLYYTSRGSAWSGFEVVDQGVGIGFHSSLAVDSYGVPHVSYYDEGHGDLRYASRSGGWWQVRTIDSAGTVGEGTALALDQANHAWIAYYDGSNANLKVARETSSGWQLQVVDSVGDTGREPAIAIGPDGVVHVAYHDVTNNLLKHAYYKDSHWNIETIATGSSEPSIAVDARGFLYVSYYDNVNYNLKFAYSTDGSWKYELVDSPGDVGMFNAIGIGTDNRVRIAYLDSTNGDLKFAVRLVLSQ